jgi:hypothetical protein
MDIPKISNKIRSFCQKLDKIDKILILILIISLILRLCTLSYSSFRGWDETVYLNLGLDLSKHPFNYSLLNSGWSDYIPSSDLIYGWPNIGFRAPLLPYLYSVFNFFKIGTLIPFVIPVITTVSVFLVFKLGQILFDKKVGLYSSFLFSLVPINLYCNGKVWTDSFVVFFILLTFISFWKGYIKENKKHKVLFGVFLALSLLARYTTLWITPVFLFFFIIKNKSLSFLRDRYLWYAIGVFFLVLIPWFIYGFFYYGNPFGGFIHGFMASSYWGGVQSWSYFIDNFWRIFSIIGILFIFSLLYIISKKEFIKKEVYILLIWVVFFLGIVMAMPHKEDRFIMPIVPVICLISGFFISKLGKVKDIVFCVLCLILLFSVWNSFKVEIQNSKDLSVACFLDGNNYLSSNVNKNSLVVSNQDPIVHYYSHKDVVVYPALWSLDVFRQIINSKYSNRDVYMFFSNYDMVMDSGIKKDLDTNFDKKFECKKDYAYSAIYKYK